MKKKLAFVVAFLLLFALSFGLAACSNNERVTPEYLTPTVGATYGQTLGDIALPAGFSWQDPAETSVGEVGQNTFLVTFTPEDTEKYLKVKNIPVAVNVTKGTPTPSTVATLGATYGQTLADVSLPAGFAWQEEATTLVGAPGDRVFHVIFTPDDTAHYDVIRDIPVTVSVDKASYDMSNISFPSANYSYDGAEKRVEIGGVLPEGVTVAYENNALTDAGETVAIAHFAGDTENYNEIPDMKAVLTISKATYDMSGVTFDDKTVVYDGSVKTIEISGELPEGVAVSYENNALTDAGETVAIAHFAGDAENYNEIPDMTATLTIEKAAATLNTQNATTDYVYDGEAHGITGLEASGSISFDNNSYVEAGIYDVTVTVAESKNYNAGAFGPLTLTIRKDYGEFFALTTKTSDSDPITVTMAFFFDHGENKVYTFEGEVTLLAIETGAPIVSSGTMTWFYEEDAQMLAIGSYGKGFDIDWSYTFYKDGDEWKTIGEENEWGFLNAENVSVEHYVREVYYNGNSWQTQTTIFLSGDGGAFDNYENRFCFWIGTDGSTPLRYAEIVTGLTNNTITKSGAAWRYVDDGHGIGISDYYEPGSFIYAYRLDEYGIEAGYYGAWYHLELNGKDYLLTMQDPHNSVCGEVYVFDSTEYTATQLAHMQIDLDYFKYVGLEIGDSLVKDSGYWEWDDFGDLVLYIDDEEILLTVRGHEAALKVGEVKYIYHDIKGNATYSFNALESAGIDRCFVYEGICTEKELEHSAAKRFYYAERIGSVICLADGDADEADAMFIVQEGVVTPMNSGEARYLAYIVDIDEGAVVPYTLAFFDNGKDRFVLMYKGRYDVEDSLPMVGYMFTGNWGQRDNEVTVAGSDERNTRFIVSENSTVIKVDYGELFALVPFTWQGIAGTAGCFLDGVDRVAYFFANEVTEEEINDVVPMGETMYWFFEEDGKMLSVVSHPENWSYDYYLDGDEWKSIPNTDTTRIRYYTYEYSMDESENWYTTTYLFVRDKRSWTPTLYVFERDGMVAPLTYAEMAVLFAKENPTETDYYIDENGWSGTNKTISSGNNRYWYSDGDEIYVSAYYKWYAYAAADGAGYLLTRASRYGIGDVWTFDATTYTAKQVAHMNGEFACDAGILVRYESVWEQAGTDLLYLGETSVLIANKVTHTATYAEKAEPWCVGYFIQDDDDMIVEYTLVFYAYTDHSGLVYYAEGHHTLEESASVDLSLMGVYVYAYGNYYYVYNDDFDEYFEVNGSVATIYRSNIESAIMPK